MCCFKNKFRHHYTTDASCAFHLVGFCNCTNLNIQNLNFWQSFHQMQKYFWINDNVQSNFVLTSRISKSCLDPISDHKCSRQNRNNRQHHHGQAHQVVKIYLTHSAVQTGWHIFIFNIYILYHCVRITHITRFHSYCDKTTHQKQSHRHLSVTDNLAQELFYNFFQNKILKQKYIKQV